MRFRIATTALLALGFATLAFARQGAEKAQAPAESKAALRPKLARLRAEVELMQLEHEGDVDVMKELIKSLKFTETMEAARSGPVVDDLRKRAEALPKPRISTPGGVDVGRFLEDQGKADALLDQGALKMLRKAYDDARASFLDRSTALNERQLELLDLESRMNMAQ